RTEDQSIKERSRRSKTRTVVVPGQEPDAVGRRDVLPVAVALANDRQRFGGAESQSRGAAAVWQIPLSGCFTFAAQFKTETDSRRVSKSLRLGRVRYWQVIYLREAKIPLLVQCRRLRVSPERVHRRANENFDVDAHGRTPLASGARCIASIETAHGGEGTATVRAPGSG